jgi:uncharacterized protein (TIGR03545 family)
MEEEEITTEPEEALDEEAENTNTLEPTPEPADVPRVFEKPIRKVILEKKFAKYIEHTGDKSFFMSCFEERDGNYVIRSPLYKDDVKKLNRLLKVVKKNRKGAVHFIPLLFAAAVVAAIVFFFTIFANPLLEHALEKGLEAAFEAKSDVRGLRISLIRFRISIGSITVANRDSPMTNIFQIGRTEIRLRPEAVLRGKIYIEEISAASISFGTERTFSGTLPGKPPRTKSERQKKDVPPLVNLENFDAMALLNQEYEKLSTPRLYDEAINAYNETAEKWKTQIETSTTRIEELQAASQPVLSINVNSFSDWDSAARTIQDISAMASAVQNTFSEVGNIFSSIERDVNTARQLEANARNALNDDINLLKSYIDLGSGAAFSALEPFILDILSDTGQQYLNYGMIALEVFEKLKSNAASHPKTEKPKREPRVIFRGRDVAFPVAAYPSFYLGTFKSDVTQGSWNGAFNLSNISSNPDLTNRPISLTLTVAESNGSQRKIEFDGNADLRTNTSERFNAVVTGTSFPISINDLGDIGIEGFSGETSFLIRMNGQPDGGFSAGGDVKIGQARIINPEGTIAEAAASAVSQAGSVDLGIQYIHYVEQNDEFRLTSNIADLFGRALRNLADAYIKKALDDIDRALRQRIEEYIADRLDSKEQADIIMRSARGDMAAIDQLKSGLDAKRNELEQKVRTAAEDAARDAARQAGEAIQNAIPGLPWRW